MRSKVIRSSLFLAVVVLAPSLALGGGAGIKFTDEPARLPPDGSLPDTSSVDADLFDIDADGDLDLFIAEGTAGPAGRPNRLLVNDGTGFYTDGSAARLPPAVTNSTRSDEGDVDGDGDLDLVVGSLGPEELYLNDGAGFFTDGSAQLPPPPPFFQGISSEARFVDVDGDHDLDILVANENPFLPGPLDGGQDRLYVNDGTGHFTDQTAARLPAVNDQTGGFATGDLDGDGDIDVIVLNRGQDLVLVNDGAGFFANQTATRFPVTTDTTRDGALADLDGDGDLDLVVANSRAEAAREYLNDGSGRFAETTFTTDDYPHETLTSVDVADVDGDGDLDVLIGNAGTFISGHGFAGGQNLFFRNDAHGKFKDRTAHSLPAVADPTTDATFGDIDGDGDLDLVTANSGGAERISIQKGD